MSPFEWLFALILFLMFIVALMTSAPPPVELDVWAQPIGGVTPLVQGE